MGVGVVAVAVEALPAEPIPGLVAGLFAILVLVLVLPFVSRRVEENLEPFFLLMGIIGVTLNYYYKVPGTQTIGDLINLAKKAVTTPLSVAGLPIGITQVVFIFGLIFIYFHKPIYNFIDKTIRKLGFTWFVFLFIIILGHISSIISVIVTAVILAEIAAALDTDRKARIQFVVLTAFAVGLGAALTPIGEPLSTIAVSNLNASFDYLFRILGAYIIPGIIVIAIYAAFTLRKFEDSIKGIKAEYEETVRQVTERAIRVFLFIAALELLGHSFVPIVIWYFSKLDPMYLYWVNVISAVVDNATLTAAEIHPALTEEQIRSALMSLLISGGMLIPGNIPNIVAAGRLKISMEEWARVGVPVGIVLLLMYFIMIEVIGIHITI